MRADAELALRTPARGRRFRSHALALLGVSHRLAGEVDDADDLFADAVEEGLELGAHEVAAVALGERASVAIGHGRWDAADELAEQPHPIFPDRTSAILTRLLADGWAKVPGPSLPARAAVAGSGRR